VPISVNGEPRDAGTFTFGREPRVLLASAVAVLVALALFACLARIVRVEASACDARVDVAARQIDSASGKE